MKVIDLLNKIANGEEVPKKIKVGNYYYEFYERLDNYYNYKEIDINSGKYFDDYLSDTYFLDSKNVLNWEVEIIEEDNKIKKNIHICEIIPATKELSTRDNFNLINQNIDKLYKYICDIRIKQNEIIDRINKE